MANKQPAKTNEEVEKRTEEWHNSGNVEGELYEYLGWTRDQYAKFVETGQLPDFTLKPINS